MKNLKIKTTALLIVVASLFSINLKAQSDFLITYEGEKVPITSDVQTTGWLWSFYKDKKEVYYKGDKIKYAELGGKQFITVSAAKKGLIMEVICYDDKYILTFSLDNYYVFDWDLQLLQHRAFPPSDNIKKSKICFNEFLLPLFKDNATLMKSFNDNMTNLQDFKTGMHSFKGGTKDINTLIKAYLDGKVVGGNDKLHDK